MVTTMAMAIFTTWTTYGTWLPGDTRGWFKSGVGLCDPDSLQLFRAELQMNEDAVLLDASQRQIIEKTIVDHCRIRKWILHAINCRTNHVHVLFSADVSIELPREQFKAWCTRKLKAICPGRKNWWTERGWDVYVDDDKSFADVTEYIHNQ